MEELEELEKERQVKYSKDPGFPSPNLFSHSTLQPASPPCAAPAAAWERIQRCVLLTQHVELYAFDAVTHTCAFTILDIDGTAVGPRVPLLEGLQAQGHVPCGDRVDQGHSRFICHGTINVRQHLVRTGHLLVVSNASASILSMSSSSKTDFLTAS